MAALLDQSRMRSPGLAEVERAKADGRWQAAREGARTARVPAGLGRAALTASPGGTAFFETLDGRNHPRPVPLSRRPAVIGAR